MTERGAMMDKTEHLSFQDRTRPASFPMAVV